MAAVKPEVDIYREQESEEYPSRLLIALFNARAQRSWRRRLWHRPRTPSLLPSSSWRLQRWETKRARITKFGSEVKFDERCSHTKFDVTGYFRSPASGRFVNYFSNFTVHYLLNGWTIKAPNLERRTSLVSSTSHLNVMVLSHSVRLYNAKTFSGTQAHIFEST